MYIYTHTYTYTYHTYISVVTYSFYPFPSLFRQYKLWNGESRNQRFSSPPTMGESVIR